MIIATAQIFSSFFLLTILSILIERSLSLVFENKHVCRLLDGRGVKDIIAFAVACYVCYAWKVDVISLILQVDSKDMGYVLTALAIAGGSKASIKLFQDVMGLGK